MEDDDLDLSLNLNITTSAEIRRNRPKIKGTTKERIKQRKQIKFQAAKEEEQSRKRKEAPTDDATTEPTEGGEGNPPPAKFAKKDGQAFGPPSGGAKKAGKEVISSLFRHNPDIPTVKSTEVTVKKEEVFASTKFSDLPLLPHLVSNLEEKMKLATMTRVQQMSIPTILREKDVLMKSQTGSGKTLAYAVPIVHTLASMTRKVQRINGPFALVVVPTRELALQSYETFVKLLQSCVWVVAGCLMGGEKRNKEKSRIRKGINILVSTPGRLLDHMQHTDCLLLDRVQWMVIDEADRLLELGYEKDIAQIVSILNSRCTGHRQTILVSATLSPGVERLSGMALKDHQTIDASEEGGGGPPGAGGQAAAQSESFAMPENLKQHFVMVPCKVRLVTLAAFLLWKCKMQNPRSKMVVFLNTQDSVEFHHQLFHTVLNGRPAPGAPGNQPAAAAKKKKGEEELALDLFKLHGDMPQKERTQVFQEFSSASSGILLCTDVASRGLHLPRVDWIVQYTTPGATVDYIHRVGRTARVGRQGNALLFLMPSEADYIQELNKHNISLKEMAMPVVLKTLLSAIQDLPLHSMTETRRQFPRTYEEASTFMMDRFEEGVLNDRNLQSLAAKGYQSFVRAYATYPSQLKAIFSLKDLHLGHVAKSFALRKAPSNVHSSAGKGVSKPRKSWGHPRLELDESKKGFKRSQKRKLPLSSTVSEFGSGFASDKGFSTKKGNKWAK